MEDGTKTGRLSDLADARHRADWSAFTKQLKDLEPGDRVCFECPARISVPAFRSTILTVGNRIHAGDWRVSTRTYGRKVHCFLALRENTEDTV